MDPNLNQCHQRLKNDSEFWYDDVNSLLMNKRHVYEKKYWKSLLTSEMGTWKENKTIVTRWKAVWTWMLGYVFLVQSHKFKTK